MLLTALKADFRLIRGGFQGCLGRHSMDMLEAEEVKGAVIPPAPIRVSFVKAQETQEIGRRLT
jgi:hypothetical protein